MLNLYDALLCTVYDLFSFHSPTAVSCRRCRSSLSHPEMSKSILSQLVKCRLAILCCSTYRFPGRAEHGTPLPGRSPPRPVVCCGPSPPPPRFPILPLKRKRGSALKSLLTNTHHEIVNLHATRTGSVGRGSVAADGNQRHQGGWKNDKRSSKPTVYHSLSHLCCSAYQ